MGWHPSNAVRMSVTGQNLFDDQHVEFPETGIANSEIPRTLFAKVDWSF
ncbi:MAG: hypothetical protein H7832_11685 [Magnetococcus sp. DMHC-6]